MQANRRTEQVDADAAPLRAVWRPGVDRAGAWLMLALILGTTVALCLLADTLFVNPDTVQLMSTARNLLAGNGLSSSIVYYDPQYDAGTMPVPQTVWPPLYAWLLAGALTVGLPAGPTAIALGIAAHSAVAMLLYAALRRLQVRAMLAMIASAAWLIHPAEWYMSLAAYTEPFFIATTFVSALCLLPVAQSPRWQVGWLAAASFFASLAILTRYSGVLWSVAAGAWFLLSALRTRSWRPLGQAAVFGALPALTTASLLLRNYVETGRFSGGQFEFGSPASLVDALRGAFWKVEPLVGSIGHFPLLFALVVVGCLWAGVTAYANLRRRLGDSTAVRALALLELSGGYGLATVAFLLINATLVSDGFLQYRYFIPVAPFALATAALAAQDVVHRFAARPSAASRWRAAALLAALIVPFTSVCGEFVEHWPPVPAHPATVVIHRALAQKMPDGRTLQDSLSSAAVGSPAILAHHEHRVALATRQPVYGLSDVRFTNRIWTTQAVEQLVHQRGISQVLFFPAAYDERAAHNANTAFFSELKAGKVPAWLHVRYAGDGFVLYDVAGDVAGDAGEP